MSNIVSRQTKHHQERSLEKVQLNQAAPVLTNTMDCDYSVVNQAFVGNDVNINATSCITDPDGDQLSWSVQDTSGSPHSWMNADAVTGLITGQIPDVGDYSAVAVATDPSGLSASQPFFVTGIPPFTAGELILNNSTDGDQAIVGVLTLDNGYVVARYGYVGVKWDQTWLQFLDLDGNTVRELQFDGSYDYVNSKESDYLGFSGFKLLPNGNFAASWIHASQELTQSGDEVGGLQAPFWRDRTFATLDNGLTVRLTDDPISNPDGTVHGIVGVQLFDSNNNAVSTKISPTINSSDGIASSDVLAIPGGKFIVSWMNQDGRDGSMYGSYSRLFSSALTNGEITPLGSDVLLNINTYKSQADGMVAFGSDGRVLAVWSSTYGPNGVKWSSTYGRIIDMSEFTALPSPSIAPSPSLAAPSPSPTPLPVPSPKSAPSTVSTSVVPSPTPLPVSSPSVASSSVAQSPSLVPSPVPSPVSPSVVPSPTPTPTPLPVPSPSAVSPSVVQSPSLAPSPVPSPVSPSVVPSPTPTPTPTPMPVQSPSVVSPSVAQSPSLAPSPVPFPVSPSEVPSPTPTPTPTPMPVPSPSIVSPSVFQSPSLVPSPVPFPVSPSGVSSPTPTPTPTPLPVPSPSIVSPSVAPSLIPSPAPIQVPVSSSISRVPSPSQISSSPVGSPSKTTVASPSILVSSVTPAISPAPSVKISSPIATPSLKLSSPSIVRSPSQVTSSVSPTKATSSPVIVPTPEYIQPTYAPSAISSGSGKWGGLVSVSKGIGSFVSLIGAVAGTGGEDQSQVQYQPAQTGTDWRLWAGGIALSATVLGLAAYQVNKWLCKIEGKTVANDDENPADDFINGFVGRRGSPQGNYR